MQPREFGANKGLRQGGVRSPVLFNIFVGDVMQDTRNKTSKLYLRHRYMEPLHIDEWAFAADLIIVGKMKRISATILRYSVTPLEAKWLKINEEKTKIMVTGKDRATNVHLMGKCLKQFDTFKYLGININDKGFYNIELTTRIC